MKRMKRSLVAFGKEGRGPLHGAFGPACSDTPALRLEYPFLASEAALDDFVRRWQAGRLTKAEWTHGAHVGTAAYFAFDLEREALFERMKVGIIHHNDSVGTANTEDHGYHETLTRFWVETIGAFVRDRSFSTRFEAVRHATERFGQDQDRHRLYYRFDVVRDRRARREWIKPDRQPPSADAPARP
jgi:hypothetical protein